MLAERMSRVSTSPTMKVAGEAAKLKRQGVDVVDFGAGEPDFPTPQPAKDAAKVAIDQNFTKYTPPAGMPDLKQAICARYKTDYGVSFAEAECIVTAGGKQALYNTAMVLYNPGDEVITHAPYWPTIPEQVKLADAKPVIVQTKAGRRLCDSSGRDHLGHHVAHEGHHHQLAGESDRRRDFGGEPCGDRGCRIEARHLGHRRPVLRKADLRQRAAQPREGADRSHARSHHSVRLGVEGVFDDGLALRLDSRPERRRDGRRHASGTFDVERRVDLAESGASGADRLAGSRRRDVERVQGRAATS